MELTILLSNTIHALLKFLMMTIRAPHFTFAYLFFYPT